MSQPGGHQPDLRVGEPAARLTQHRIVGHEQVPQPDVAVPADRARVDGAHPAPDLPAGVVRVDQEHGGALGGAGPLGPGHDDREPGPVRARDELLVTVQHPAAVRAPGGGAQRGRVRAGARRRLGHREAGPHLARHERAQVALLLPGRAGHRQQVHVPLVGRGAVGGQRAQRAVSGLLQQQGRGREVGPAPAELRGRLRSQHPRRPRRVLQPDPQRVINAGDERLLLQRNHRAGDEIANPLPEGLRPSRERDADRHRPARTTPG